MGINRRCRNPPVFKAKVDPFLCCVICGAEIPLYERGEVFEEREDWKRPVMKHRNKSVIVPAKELEQTDFVKYPHAWSFFVRAILDDPKTGQMSLSGISHGSSLKPWELPIPRDPQRAFIRNLALAENHWNADFHMANLFGRDKNREAGERIGYPIHPHCWLLLKRFVGHDLIMSNLHAFVRAIGEFWKANKKHWRIFLDHVSVDGVECVDDEPGSPCTHWLKEPRTYTSAEDREHFAMLANWRDELREWHSPGSPLRIPDIQSLITQNIQPQKDNSGQGQCEIQPPVFCLPLDIAVMVVDLIYETQPHCQQRIDDIRNLLEAFRWRLPNTYWQARCNTELLFEFDDLIKAGTAVNWLGLCLGIEELLLDDNWYCNSGLNNRARTLKQLNGIKEGFLRRLNRGVGR
ncbi:hypothetical protein CNMCM5793_009666 [Aspergillus hiratsukae]|uniref:Uncharacterized protein n=1 Tax=Aspergillus hiratsukae TaxID=1194566 RepID=A0A8H6U9Z3_9EURO|nr:hypothetical protein CNMCM5793_009666 [Aspergillus hiratsukae]KAF7156188.1 hypothetical protein CNMCM6106_009253 [Aspergillus hiratsukae]